MNKLLIATVLSTLALTGCWDDEPKQKPINPTTPVVTIDGKTQTVPTQEQLQQTNQQQQPTSKDQAPVTNNYYQSAPQQVAAPQADNGMTDALMGAAAGFAASQMLEGINANNRYDYDRDHYRNGYNQPQIVHVYHKPKVKKVYVKQPPVVIYKQAAPVVVKKTNYISAPMIKQQAPRVKFKQPQSVTRVTTKSSWTSKSYSSPKSYNSYSSRKKR